MTAEYKPGDRVAWAWAMPQKYRLYQGVVAFEVPPNTMPPPEAGKGPFGNYWTESTPQIMRPHSYTRIFVREDSGASVRIRLGILGADQSPRGKETGGARGSPSHTNVSTARA